MIYRDLYVWGTKQLAEANILDAKIDARLLLEACCGTDQNTLLAHGEREISENEYKSYVNHIKQRTRHIPLQHITGNQEFMGLSFLVNEHVLIPRQDTEILVEEAMRHLHDGMAILDVCTGSGCILLSLLHYSNDCIGVGTDISGAALEIAEKNREQLGIEAEFYKSDLFEVFHNEELAITNRKFDLIISNPPYINSNIIETLMPEVKEHEPMSALDGGEDGLIFYRKIIKQAGGFFNRGGMLFFEIGYDQGEAVCKLMKQAGYADVKVKKDYSGLARVVYGTSLEEKNV